jgi:poly(A) polymerase
MGQPKMQLTPSSHTQTVQPIIGKLPPDLGPEGCKRILKALREAGHTAYICGGAPRDSLLGVPPKDWDISSSASPDEAMKILSPIADAIVPVGKSFGVIVCIIDQEEYQIATFRSEEGYADARHPDRIHFSTPSKDAERRDFTINALFYDPERGEIWDYVGAIPDIEKRVLRCVGDPEERFKEDRLRLLRAVRFSARTGFAIEENTRRALMKMASSIPSVSAERIAQEIEAMLIGGHAERSFALLMESGLLQVILPEICRLKGVEQPPQFHPEGDVWTHTLLMLRFMDEAFTEPYEEKEEEIRLVHNILKDKENRLKLAWSAALHDTGKPGTFQMTDRIHFNGHDRLGAQITEAVLTRLKRSRELINAAADLVSRHMQFPSLPHMRKANLRRFLQDESFLLHLELHRLDCLSSHGLLTYWRFSLQAWIEEQARPPITEPLVSGLDVISLGAPKGPMIGRLLDAVKEARLEGTISTKEEALQFLKGVMKIE